LYNLYIMPLDAESWRNGVLDATSAHAVKVQLALHVARRRPKAVG